MSYAQENGHSNVYILSVSQSIDQGFLIIEDFGDHDPPLFSILLFWAFWYFNDLQRVYVTQ